MRTEKCTLLLADLVGYTQFAATLEAAPLAAFLDEFYAACAAAVARHGGTVVKFIGDSCLATFPADAAAAAIDCARAIEVDARALGARHGRHISASANIHVATVATGEIGPEGCRQRDVIGAGVNHCFLMGGGAGLRISEPAYRQLPADLRNVWRKHRPPATYTLTR